MQLTAAMFFTIWGTCEIVPVQLPHRLIVCKLQTQLNFLRGGTDQCLEKYVVCPKFLNLPSVLTLNGKPTRTIETATENLTNLLNLLLKK